MKLPDPAQPLARDDARDAFGAIFDGRIGDDALAAFLLALATRGETPPEIVGAAEALRARMVAGCDAPEAIDVCGTGGDGKHSLNVSTAVAITVAACGVKVAKHGNRAASSASGAADVLGALGVPMLPVERLPACLDSVGIAFFHAVNHHPAMARVAPVRRALGRRTIFNLLGPLANPARVPRQLVGVFSADWLVPMAGALIELGSTRAMVVHGDGYDELTVTAPSHYALAAHGRLSTGRLDPETLGLARHPATALAGGDPAHNAARLEALLAGARGGYHDMVVMNAAAALAIADPALSLGAAAARAADALASGAAADTLARWKAFR
ncbi:anthranilate phosphoribosyltransferase [alpha proteobacterium AAP81b]|nr:anthranilate phosphoribosyltransferase [alpha proteobacterium AAP81b]